MTDTMVRRMDRHLSDVPSRIALTFVFAAVVALVAVPWMGARATRPLYMELTDVLAPARGRVTRVNAALALEGSLLRDYVMSHDSALTRRYRDAYAREVSATEELASLVGVLGTRSRTALADFRREQTRWHEMIEQLLLKPERFADRDPLRGREYERVLDAVVRLDAELESAGQARRSEVLRLELLQSRVAMGLGVLALAAAVVVAWLAQRVSVYAAMLQQRGVALERAIEGRARLMRGVTHDLKNPLHAMDGHAQLLEDEVLGSLGPKQRDSVKRMRRSVTTMLGLIDDLLDLARAEAGQLRITPHPVDVMPIVRDVVAEFRPMAEKSGHVLALAEPEPALLAHADAPRVRQILGNLLSNAIKYTPPGGRVIVQAELRDGRGPLDGERWVKIAVSDNGAGIPEVKQQEIFTDFTRLDSHAGIPGAGLGLSISRQIAKLLGGDLTLDSALGEGATFTLWLPQERRRAE